MRAIFSEKSRLQKLLQVEVALASAHADQGTIPKGAVKTIASAVDQRQVTVGRVAELEAEVKHDIMALVLALSEVSGDAGRYVHLGATSSDILDSATALQLKEALPMLGEGLLRLRAALLTLATAHKGTVMVGRTHGQAAVPLTFGLKMAVFALEVQRHRERLRQAAPRILVGKMSGAVGTGAAFGKDALKLQDRVMERLGLGTEVAATQIVSRDRYAEYVALLAGIAASLERFATEVRNLQRTEIGEVAEAFGDRQVGSSTMAQKENPITSENICGLARIVRGFVGPAYENVPLWHERDLTNSSAERFILPHVTVLVDDILHKAATVFETLRVREDRMAANLEATQGMIMAEAVMMALARKGMDRQAAHELVREVSRRATAQGVSLQKALEAEGAVVKVLPKKELLAAMDPEGYIGSSAAIVDRVVALCEDSP